jgi:mannose-6-phosphate isomerase-like protein (cupin superfamily)
LHDSAGGGERAHSGPSGGARGKLVVKLSTPGAHVDNQKPHEQDEIYMVIRGRGTFFHDGQRRIRNIRLSG